MRKRPIPSPICYPRLLRSPTEALAWLVLLFLHLVRRFYLFSYSL